MYTIHIFTHIEQKKIRVGNIAKNLIFTRYTLYINFSKRMCKIDAGRLQKGIYLTYAID